ncbi:hypothetical protein Tco_1225370 [Tanacetum coccineum]
MRTASAAAKPYQGDSSEFYLITGNIYADQREPWYSRRLVQLIPDESFRHSDTERLSRSDEVLKLKNFKKDAPLKLFKSTNQERYEHGVQRSHSRQDKEQAQDLKSMITTSNHKLMIEVKDYEHKTKVEVKDGYTRFQHHEQYEHVGPEVTRSQEGKRLQDDDKRLCLVDDLKEVQDSHNKSSLYRTSSSLKSMITTTYSQDNIKKTNLRAQD